MGPVRAQRCPVRLPALRSRASAPHVLSLRRQTHPAAFLGRFSPLLEAEYISDVADARPAFSKFESYQAALSSL